MRFMISNLRHVGLVVNDLDKLILFYNKLGFNVADRNKEEGDYIEKLVKIKGVKLEWVKMELKDNSMLELLKYQSPSSAKVKKKPQKSNRMSWSHISLTTDSIVDTINIINEYGGNADKEYLFSPDGKVKVIYCHDPEGNILEIVEEL
jgi:catechol 2,3-dioxygenase-like lactoylglutathione lyase family enzyme